MDRASRAEAAPELLVEFRTAVVGFLARHEFHRGAPTIVSDLLKAAHLGSELGALGGDFRDPHIVADRTRKRIKLVIVRHVMPPSKSACDARALRRWT